MNQDKVKTWVSSISYYKVKRKNDDKKYLVVKEHSIKEGYNILPKKTFRDDIIEVTKLVITSPLLITNLLKKKEQKKQQKEQIKQELEKEYDDKIDKYEELIDKKDEAIEDKDIKIAKLKDQLRKIKEQMKDNDQEEEYENHHRR
jgi:hypothetical protein